MKKYLLLIAVAGLFLTSCKKCKDCEIKVDVLSSSTLDDAACQEVYNMSCQDYYNSLYAGTATEYCGDELDAAEATADVSTSDYRIYWDCK